ncbi:flagellar filament capping protein FliD [Isachenkonia alkalipeptolytica]|uniref:Flagellar hook-associated protein 2 n=1 Tax=Isachenkonia alkalipeptolytica TaxID=2565777 RepID=A0AA44BG10_9CLOT|nr:flagellar filament capping protein FliD [Isachenkonia alkalipeptolytica]NBG89400.1 hypothetical protein [Isachenkonia alkalipeptolytica]
MRMGGLMSGMDTEQMVRDLMKVERMKVDRFTTEQTEIEWKQEAYHDVNKTMANFVLNTRQEFGISSGFGSTNVNNLPWIKSATADGSAVTASARGNAIEGNHEVEVENLAEVARTTSLNLKGDAEAALLDEDGIIHEDFFVDGDEVSFEMTTSAGTGTITLEKGMNMRDVTRAFNNAVVDEGDNAGQNLGLRTSYDAGLDRMMIMTRNSGEEEFMHIDATTDTSGIAGAIFSNEGDQNIFTEVQRDEDGNIERDGEGNPTHGIGGQDARITFNGDEITSSNNNVSVFGIDLQLRTKGTTTVRVETDVDGIYDQIKGFVDEYNDLIDAVNGPTQEKYDREYGPLTDEQRQAMNEDDIEKWEERARSGLLANDRTLTRTLQTLRSSMYESIENTAGEYSHITQIGISTGNYQQGGRLEIEEDKLRDAIANDPEGVLDVFFKAPAEGEGKEGTGLVQRAYDDITDGMKEVIRQSGPGEDAGLYRNVRSNLLIDFVTQQGAISRLDRDVQSIQQRIATEERRLMQTEERYWNQFTAMEKAMSQMNDQAGWLAQQMGGMGMQ